MPKVTEEIIIEKSNNIPILLTDYYTKCNRCDTSIPKGIKDYCSPDCELGNKKLNI